MLEKTFTQRIENNKNKIYRDDLVTIVLDINPISKGHALIVPNDHYLDLDEMPDEVVEQIFKVAKVYVKILKEKFNPKGYSMMQNGGCFNDINHFHLHVFARNTKEEFEYSYSDEVEEGAMDVPELRALLAPELISEMKNQK